MSIFIGGDPILVPICPDIPCSRTMLMPQDGEAMQEAMAPWNALMCPDCWVPQQQDFQVQRKGPLTGVEKIGASGQSHLHGLLV